MNFGELEDKLWRTGRLPKLSRRPCNSSQPLMSRLSKAGRLHNPSGRASNSSQESNFRLLSAVRLRKRSAGKERKSQLSKLSFSRWERESESGRACSKPPILRWRGVECGMPLQVLQLMEAVQVHIFKVSEHVGTCWKGLEVAAVELQVLEVTEAGQARK